VDATAWCIIEVEFGEKGGHFWSGGDGIVHLATVGFEDR
jgi:hypothetical protein